MKTAQTRHPLPRSSDESIGGASLASLRRAAWGRASIPANATAAAIRAIGRRMAASGGRLVYFYDPEYCRFMPTPEELREALPLRPIAEEPEGVIWAINPGWSMRR